MNKTTDTPREQTDLVADPWGARVRDWAEIEDENSSALFGEVLDATGVRGGTSLLDVGCGSGLACAIAAKRGALVSGLDASPGMVRAAAERVPAGDFRVGDMASLPFGDASFDAVIFVNSFFFASDREVTLREAGRVARGGGRIAVVVWTAPETVDLTAYLAAMDPLMPPGLPQIDPFMEAAELEALARRAGLAPERTFEADWSWDYPDLETALRGLLSPGPSAAAIEAAGENAARDAITAALEPYRTTGGGYRLENVVRCTVAAA